MTMPKKKIDWGGRRGLKMALAGAMILLVLTIASDFPDVILAEHGFGAFIASLCVTFAFFVVVILWGFKGLVS